MHEAQQAVRAAGLGSPLAHLATTSGTATDPATHLGMVRVGAGLVGIDPSGTVEMHGASRLTAPIVHTTAVEAGTPVGYAGTHFTDRATHLSVLPVGYADGIPRELSPRAGVEICGRRFPVVGPVHALRCAARFDDRTLIEDVVPGPEIDVAVLVRPMAVDGRRRRWRSRPTACSTPSRSTTVRPGSECPPTSTAQTGQP
jgi:alanine racemase